MSHVAAILTRKLIRRMQNRTKTLSAFKNTMKWKGNHMKIWQ